MKRGRPPKHGLCQSSTYRTWRAMKARCQYPSVNGYARYGGRGIRVCERWQSFEMFLADMGFRPAGMTLDRISIDGHYEPSNCRWVTRRDQQRTRKHSIGPVAASRIKWFYLEGYTQKEIAMSYGIDMSMVSRIVTGDSYEGVDH